MAPEWITHTHSCIIEPRPQLTSDTGNSLNRCNSQLPFVIVIITDRETGKSILQLGCSYHRHTGVRLRCAGSSIFASLKTKQILFKIMFASSITTRNSNSSSALVHIFNCWFAVCGQKREGKNREGESVTSLQSTTAKSVWSDGCNCNCKWWRTTISSGAECATVSQTEEKGRKKRGKRLHRPSGRLIESAESCKLCPGAENI